MSYRFSYGCIGGLTFVNWDISVYPGFVEENSGDCTKGHMLETFLNKTCQRTFGDFWGKH